MLHHPTLDQLRHLKLHGMARAFAELGDNAQAGELDHAQWLALLLDREEAERNDRRLTYRLRNARLRHPDACIEDVDSSPSMRPSTTSSMSNAIWSPAEHSANSAATR